MKTPQSIAESLLGGVEWTQMDHGFCHCPGEPFHTNPNRSRDCQVFLSGAPTIFCFHASCRAEVERANKTLRRSLRKGETGVFHGSATSAANIEKRREYLAFQRLKRRAQNSLPDILSKHSCHLGDLIEQSPVSLNDVPGDDWRLLLRIFRQTDTVWIGDVLDSGPGHEGNFQTVSSWLTQKKAPGAFTCPSVFSPGSFSRSKESIEERRFLVVESDTLPKEQFAAILLWIGQFLKMRAIVDTAGKSLHGWFEAPKTGSVEHELRIILPVLGCDPALFKPSQPCRLPGAKRGEKTQALIWLDLGGTRHE